MKGKFLTIKDHLSISLAYVRQDSQALFIIAREQIYISRTRDNWMALRRKVNCSIRVDGAFMQLNMGGKGRTR